MFRLVVVLLCCAGCVPASDSARPVASPPPSAGNPADAAINAEYFRQFSLEITGQEDVPAEQIFENVQSLKGVPAGQFLGIMRDGYSAALGVSCTHCHVDENFASDDKRPKRAAREMVVMHRLINEQLKTMTELESDSGKRSINCATCHRGMVNPRGPAKR